ncbi:MAG TPA: chitobiase/beta-hexosaminidase C-terminal domain-containing protein [Fibrobacteria bacterium]|nr:chitobiase/beta-hexosaminidase C-terminal domain-containing protein [Fibrobacteria bacterium]
MNKSYAYFASLALAATGVLSSCDNYTTTPTASPAPVDTTTPWTATVAFSPIAGTYPDAQSVTLTAADTTASIYYTLDNSVPTTASTLYKGAIPVNATSRIKAITVKGGVASVVSVAAYVITIPTFSPAAGVYNASQSVKLSSSDPNAAIYYTTDGSIPTRSSTMYSAAIAVKSTTTINAVAVDAGISSTMSSATYTLPLLFSPAAGSYTGAQKVTLSTGNPGDTIYYTTDGSAPTGSSTLYTGAIAVGSTEAIKAVTVKAGKTSAVYSAAYTITVLSFKPVAGLYTRAQSVTLSTINAGDTIYYTTDGSTPTRSSNLYGAAIPVASNDTIKAISVNGATSSTVYKAFYQFIPWDTTGIVYGSVSDPAGTVYKTVAIGSQTWMAENLNYAGGGSAPIGTCYKGSSDSCAKYGRLYSWAQAMNGSVSSSTASNEVQGICPTGWHVPTDTEWSTLLKFVDPTDSLAGAKLKAAIVGWKANNALSGNGSDAYGFRALPAGDTVEAAFNVAGSAGFWWSATASDSANAWTRSIEYNSSSLFRYEYDKTFGYSLRCLKD